MNFENPNDKVSLANTAISNLSALQCIGLFVFSLLAISFWGCAADSDKSSTDEHKEQLSGDTIPLDNKPRVVKVVIKTGVGEDPSLLYIELNLSTQPDSIDEDIYIRLTPSHSAIPITDTIQNLQHCTSSSISGSMSATIDTTDTYIARLTGNMIETSDSVRVQKRESLGCPQTER